MLFSMLVVETGLNQLYQLLNLQKISGKLASLVMVNYKQYVSNQMFINNVYCNKCVYN